MKGNTKIFFAGGTWIVSFSLFVFFVLFPLFQGIQKDAAELLALRQEAVRVDSLEKEIRAFQAQKEGATSSFLRIENALVDAQTPVAFIEFLETLAKEGGFVLKITPGALIKRKEDPWATMSFQISSTATYPKALILLEKLESSPYLLRVQNVSLSRSETAVYFTIIFEVATV